MDKKVIAQLSRELNNALQALQTLRRTKLSLAEAGGLSRSEKWLIMHLALCGHDRQTPTHIADKLGITLAAVTHKLNSLEEQGYIERNVSPRDRRIVYVSLSDRGRAVFVDMKKNFDKKIRSLVERLGERDARELIRLIGKIGEYARGEN